MYSPIGIVLSVVETAINLLGFIINGFVVVVNLWDWKFKSGVLISDYLICSVALSNLSCQLWSGFNWFCVFFGHYNTFCRITPILEELSTQCSFNAGGLLCLFRCTSTVMSKNCLLGFYKRHLHRSLRRVPFCEVLMTLLAALSQFVMPQLTANSGHVSPSNSSTSFGNHSIENFSHSFIKLQILVLFFDYINPLRLGLLSAALMLVSLVKHKKWMQDAIEKNDVFIDALRCAGVTLLTWLTLILINFVMSIIILMFPERDPNLMLCELISTLYAPIFGIVLIRGDSKLRSAATRITMKVLGTSLGLHGLKEENISVHVISS